MEDGLQQSARGYVCLIAQVEEFHHGDTECTENFKAYLDFSPCPLCLCGEMTFFSRVISI
jgi:hypothetical protein